MKQKNREKRLEIRRKAADEVLGNSPGSRPGEIWGKTVSGKAKMFHRPGSLRK